MAISKISKQASKPVPHDDSKLANIAQGSAPVVPALPRLPKAIPIIKPSISSPAVVSGMFRQHGAVATKKSPDPERTTDIANGGIDNMYSEGVPITQEITASTHLPSTSSVVTVDLTDIARNQQSTSPATKSTAFSSLPTGTPLVPLSPQFDVYARPYIPEALRVLNSMPARQIFSRPVQRIDYPLFISDFAGNRYISRMPKAQSLPIMHHPDNESFPDRLTAANYQAYWSSAMSKEATAQLKELDEQNLWSVPLKSRSVDEYSLHVPGLAEGSLQVEVGDQVLLRQVSPNFVSTYGAYTFEYVAIIVGILRRDETLILRVDQLVHRTMLFNVRFTQQLRHQASLDMAVIDASAGLKEVDRDSWVQCMLFPEQRHGIMQTRLDSGSFSFEPFDSSLNFEQLRAVQSVINRDFGSVPFLIDGPPGTGKTKTLVETVLQLNEEEHSHILVCAPSDPAADTLALRLSSYYKVGELLRLNDTFRTFAEVPEKLLVHCYIENDKFALPPFPELMKCRVVVTSCRDANILVRACITNSELASLETGMIQSFHAERAPSPIQLHWTALVLDEAAQASKAQALIPLSVVRPPTNIAHEYPPIVVMAGDPKQFNPRTASKDIAMGTSLFARLLERKLYKAHPFARSQLRGGERPALTQKLLPVLRPPFATLVRNYRSHPAILAVPSSLFYNDTLIPEAADSKSLMHLEIWKGRGWPVLFSHNAGPDEIEQEGGGWYNRSEAHKALNYAQQFLQSGQVEESDICIIAPFQAQVRLLRSMARSHKLWRINIGPLEAFQGLESRIVILCTTRTRSRFLEQDMAAGFGIIKEAKRFNVAMTRARQGLVVIGNAALLAHADGNWRAFLAFCCRHRLWEGEEWKPEEDIPTHMSRLETALVYARVVELEACRDAERLEGKMAASMRFGGRDDDEAMYASALAAEDALRDEE